MGLSQPIPFLSFEFLPASKDSVRKCINALSKIGHYTFNWSKVETMKLVSPSWINGEEMASIIEGQSPTDRSGDIYARLT